MTDTNSITERLDAYKVKHDELQKEHDAIREDARQECLKLVSLFKFTAAELGLEGGDKKPAKRTGSTAKAKYQNPNGPEVWSGRGPKAPDWFKAALEEGYSKEDMLIR